MQIKLQRGDLKYYYQIHCNKQKAQGLYPVSYANFTRRLKKMNLHDAIYYPRVEGHVRDMRAKYTIQDTIRRKQINKSENIQILDLDYLTKLEMTNRIQIPKPKKKWYVRLLDFFKRK